MKDSNVFGGFNGFSEETQEERERRISSVEVKDGGKISVSGFDFEVSKRELNNDRFLLAIFEDYEPQGFMYDLKFGFSSRFVLEEKVKAYFKYNKVHGGSNLVVFDTKTGIELKWDKLKCTLDEKTSVILADAIWETLAGFLL